jgi:altronate dehydratase
MPPGFSVTVCPAGMSIATSGRILMTPPSIDIVCSSAFFATGDEAAVRRSAVGETIVK